MPTTILRSRRSGWLHRHQRRLTLLSACGLVFAAMSTCSPRLNALSEVKALGALRVITTNSPTTYYVGAGGPAGFEHDLAKGFAESLGVKLEIVIAENVAAALRLLREGRGHLAAAGVAISAERERQVRFTQPVMTVVPQLVRKMGRPRIKNLGELPGSLRVPRGSAHAEMLRELGSGLYPNLKWDEAEDQDTEDLLYQVATERIDATIASSDMVAMHQRYYPSLRVEFDLADSQALAWALPPGQDESLVRVAKRYLESVSHKEMARLRDRYFAMSEQVDYVSAVTLATHINTRLPPLRDAFQQAAEKYQLDWRLLAAMGYQESHWNPDAVSPTGVRGIMMLTLDTAAVLKINDREDPVQSIFGGAKYFRQLLDQMPADIVEPERTWMALAGYNMGIGHLLDARILTQRVGGDPRRWLDVRNTLPLLTQPKWHSQLKYGYARGYEAITYVGNVRTYYDMLTWINSGAVGAPQTEAEPPLEIPQLNPTETDSLNINSPVL